MNILQSYCVYRYWSQSTELLFVSFCFYRLAIWYYI